MRIREFLFGEEDEASTLCLRRRLFRWPVTGAPVGLHPGAQRGPRETGVQKEHPGLFDFGFWL